MKRSKTEASESGPAWLARSDVEIDLKLSLSSARRDAVKLGPRGGRGRRALQQIVVCMKAVRSGQAAAAAVAAFEVCSVLYSPHYRAGARAAVALKKNQKKGARGRSEKSNEKSKWILKEFDAIRKKCSIKDFSRRAIARHLAPDYESKPGAIDSLLRRAGRH